jgi:hypothetical protein
MNPILRTYHWLSHYLFSNTLHGTHSPFVYSFLEKVVYQPATHPSKTLSLVLRIANFAPNNTILCINAEESSLEALSNLNKNIATSIAGQEHAALGFVYFGELMHAAELMDTYHQLKHNTNSETVFVFTDVFKDEKKRKVWKHLCKDEKNIISIDLLDTGIMFFDQKKPKEHFRIYY